MKRCGLYKTAAALALVLAIAGCAGDGKPEHSAGGVAGTTGTAGTSADIDRGWILDRLEDGDLEVRLGRLAQERAADADIRAFGATMVEKHTVAGTELKRVADRHNVAPGVDRKPDNEPFEKLSKLAGREFDRAYLDMMIDAHEDAVKEMADKLDDRDEHADVKDWAAKCLPVVTQHLERARDLRERLDRGRIS